MKKLLVILAIISAVSCAGPRDLVVIHYNDTHSHLDPLRDGSAGVIERAAYVDSVRRAEGKNNLLLLHAGDFSQGSSYFTILKGYLEVDMINAMGYDCICLGNHEFDNGIEELGSRLSKLRCPVVCCNYDFSSFDCLSSIKPYAILHKAGLKIGVIGVLTDISLRVLREIADRIPSLDDENPVQRWADYLKNEKGCDLVIVLSHRGFSGESGGLNDVDMCSTYRNVDLYVGGHSHTHLDEIYVGKDASGREVPIVQNWCWGLENTLLRITPVR